MMKLFCFSSGASSSKDSDIQLRGPELVNKPELNGRKFVDEVNKKGCYIHVVSNGDDKIASDLNKIQEGKIPTPATLVGISPVRLYGKNQWENCSGLIFSPSTVSLLAYKHDFWSNRLRTICPKNLKSFSKNKSLNSVNDSELENYSEYLRDGFNSLTELTGSSFVPGSEKLLRIKEDVIFSRSKYQEISMRSFPKKNLSSFVKDNSSKFIIADLLEKDFPDLKNISKDVLVRELEKIMQNDDELKRLLQHALIKIKKFDNSRLRKYLSNSIDDVQKNKRKDFYSEFLIKHGTLVPNEHLLMPEIRDVKAIYVDSRTVRGIDHAFKINEQLEKTQQSIGIRQYNAALIYRPSKTFARKLAQVGWSQILLPWTTAGLIEFATTGYVTSKDKKKFRPKHYNMISALNSPNFTTSYVNNLSAIKDNNNNLLHMAVAAMCPLDTIKLFYYWNVSLTEKNGDGKTPLELATELTHPHENFLLEVKDWTPEKKRDEKKIFIDNELVTKPDS